MPFGTGAATAKLARGAALELYHPDCFAAVRDVTQGLRCLSELPCLLGQDTIEEVLSQMSPPIKGFLESQGALRAWRKLSEQARSPAARLRRFHIWFDGFRTLKLIHHVRDHAAASLPWQDAIRRAPFMDEVEDDGACLSEARTELLRLEQALPRLVGPSVYQ